jgi:alpha-glucosidase
MQGLRVSVISLLTLLVLYQVGAAEVFRKKFTTSFAYLIIEVLDDDLLHVEVSAVDNGSPADQPLFTSPMIFKTDYAGPSSVVANGPVLETTAIRVEIDPANLCLTVRDKANSNAYLTTLCPADLEQPFKGLNIDPGAIQQVYGLGQQFKLQGSADGDWLTFGVREGQGLGNGFMGFQGGAVGNVQIPVLYAVGSNNLNYALFLDNVYQQRWDFTAFWWETRMFGDQLRFYVMTGPNLPDLRADYMELTGKPPVPPRKSFGLWVSEFGYDNWDQIDALRSGLRTNHFPLDGLVLDLNWFGGVNLNDASKSRMGRLNWDEDNTDGNPYVFLDPGPRIQQYAADHIGLTAIEESYLANTTDTFSQMPAQLSAYRRINGVCDATNQSNPVTDVQGFWGKGRMIDWSDPNAGAWVHDHRRFPNLVQKGITSHWTDLGEPENFNGAACYDGVEVTATGRKNEHSDVHSLYNLLWNKSIWDGYFTKRGQANNLGTVNPRPFLLARSGAAGTQRYGAAMWSGDIAAHLESLATHANAQLHMSLSGIDFYGADVGGFRKEVLPYNDKHGAYRGYENETYTQWLANACWFDVPVRPHTDNEFIQVDPPYATAPHLVGKTASNLANLRQRYELIPYYYALAYRAHLFGEPVVPPLVFYYQNDPRVRKIGHEKLIGRDLLVGIVAKYGEYERDVYLPAGKWINYHTNEWLRSTGQVVEDVPVYREGILRLPVFARAGAILPQMYVDEQTKDAFGHRTDGTSLHEALIVKAYADPTASSFTLYEDDGETLSYDANGRPFYRFRATPLSQQQVSSDAVTVTIHPAHDMNATTPFTGAVNNRHNVVKLVVEGAEATAVSLNGTPLTQQASAGALKASASGWYNAGNNLIVAKSEAMDVNGTTKAFSFHLRPVTPSTSVNFVCDKGSTSPGESIYVVGDIPALGGPGWDTDRAVKLEPNIYYEYVVNPPRENRGPGPSAPVWSGVVSGIPADTTFEWKCIRKREDGTGGVHFQPGRNNSHRTTSSGYAGRSYGLF